MTEPEKTNETTGLIAVAVPVPAYSAGAPIQIINTDVKTAFEQAQGLQIKQRVNLAEAAANVTGCCYEVMLFSVRAR